MSHVEVLQTKEIFLLVILMLARVNNVFAAAPMTSSLYTMEVCTVDNTTTLQRNGFISVPGYAAVTLSASPHCVMRRIWLHEMVSPVDTTCDATWDQQGSVTWGNIVLGKGKMLIVKVTTSVAGQTNTGGFFVRPTRLTSPWERPTFNGSKTATFPIRSTGQFSVEFTPASMWRNQKQTLEFPALMLFVNPEYAPPDSNSAIKLTEKGVTSRVFDLGPNKAYIFTEENSPYDWGEQQVFKVHDNTKVYFEDGAYVRARIIQTNKKVKSVEISGYGVLDNHYEPQEYDIQGLSDDGSMQTITIYGKSIRLFGVTLINTTPKCHAFSYCLNINANWSPLADAHNPFEAGELQGKDPPYKYHKAHCQELNMDDSPNTDFTNCPTSTALADGGNMVSNVKCMTWQMGQDGLNAGKFGTVENSFVRVIDDAIKPWDTGGVYRNIVIWQLTLGWPINFGWWNWGSRTDERTLVDTVYVIHNHNWVSSHDWPETKSGQCVVGGVYGSGVAKQKYTLRNIFVETACSCAVGLEISKKAYSKHLTKKGCVGSISDTVIDGMYFDEEFYAHNGGYANFLSGETKPANGCTGKESGKIETISIAADVAGRQLSKSDFIVNDATVTGLTFPKPRSDPHPVPSYLVYTNQGVVSGHAIDEQGVTVSSSEQCTKRCQSDWSCDCVVFRRSDKKCWKRRDCAPSRFKQDSAMDVYVRPWSTDTTTTSTTTTSTSTMTITTSTSATTTTSTSSTTTSTTITSKTTTTVKPCPKTCQAKTCDSWSGNEAFTCAVLEKDYGCSCTGCTCANDKLIKACQYLKYKGDGNCDDGNNNAGCSFDGGPCFCAIADVKNKSLECSVIGSCV